MLPALRFLHPPLILWCSLQGHRFRPVSMPGALIIPRPLPAVVGAGIMLSTPAMARRGRPPFRIRSYRLRPQRCPNRTLYLCWHWPGCCPTPGLDGGNGAYIRRKALINNRLFVVLNMSPRRGYHFLAFWILYIFRACGAGPPPLNVSNSAAGSAVGAAYL